ncbi:hypothetical protein ACTFIR_002986 [Dictyostelium discoideum]
MEIINNNDNNKIIEINNNNNDNNKIIENNDNKKNIDINNNNNNNNNNNIKDKKLIKEDEDSILMKPPPIFITPANKDDTITVFHQGHIISIPRKLKINLKSITDCGPDGVMFRAKNEDSKEEVIVKKISVFLMKDDKMARKLLRNLLFQRHFQQHPLVSTFQSVFKRKSSENYLISNKNNRNNVRLPLLQQKGDDDIYFEYLLPEFTLLQMIHNKLLTEYNTMIILYQLLTVVKFIHSAGVIHRDIDPSSITIDQNQCLKLTEFYFCFPTNCPVDLFFNDYDTSSFIYRAPETIWRNTTYTTAIDVWNIGVIFGEMILGKRLFKTQDFEDHLISISKLIGNPTPEDLSIVLSKSIFQYMGNIPKSTLTPSVGIKRRFKGASKDQIELLQGMLCWDPRKRMTIDQLLAHKYFSTIHDESMQIKCNEIFGLKYYSDFYKMKSDVVKKSIENEFLTPC